MAPSTRYNWHPFARTHDTQQHGARQAEDTSRHEYLHRDVFVLVFLNVLPVLDAVEVVRSGGVESLCNSKCW